MSHRHADGSLIGGRMAPSKSSAVETGIIWSCTPSALLAGSTACRTGRYDGALASQSTPNRVACGNTSLNISSRLGAKSVCIIASPVILPPGRGRLATWPRPTGSAWVANTMGIVFVACWAGSTSVEEVAKIMSTFDWASSPASPCSWSTVSAQRNSMRMFLPST